MLLIDKAEAAYLLANGCKMGDYVHISHSNKHKYYATESPKVLSLLEEFKLKEKQK